MKENFIAQLEHSSYYELSEWYELTKICSFYFQFLFFRGSGMNGDERNCTEWRSVEMLEIWRIVHDQEAMKLVVEVLM